MSISGIFLIIFLTLHMGINLVAVFSLGAYDTACGFMGTNPLVQIMVPILALGFVVHIVYAFILSWQNLKAGGGPERYETKSATKISWASKNMLALGMVVLGGLVMHLSHFWTKMQLQEWMGKEAIKGSVLITEVFSKPFNVIVYLLWIFALCFHLIHGFWSAFQSMGLTGTRRNLYIKIICHFYVTFITGGFLTTIIYFYIHSLTR